MLIASSVIVLRWFEKKLGSLRDDWREGSALSHRNPKPGNPLPRPGTGNMHTKPTKRLPTMDNSCESHRRRSRYCSRVI